MPTPRTGAPTAGPPLRTPAFVVEFAGRKFQLFYERPWIVWLNQIQTQVNDIEELALLNTQDSAADNAAERLSIATEAILHGRATPDELLVGTVVNPQRIAGQIADCVAVMLAERHFKSPLSDAHLLGQPPYRAWADYVMRQAGGIVKLEGETVLFPGIRRSPTTPTDTQSVLANGSALTGHEVLDEAYSAAFNGKIECVTKNAFYDKIESLGLFPSVAVRLTGQTADIGPVTLASAGTQFELAYYLELTASDVAAGTVTLTISFTDDTGATTVTGTIVLTGLGALRAVGVIPIIRAAGNIAYATTHTGIFGTSQYALSMVLRRNT